MKLDMDLARRILLELEENEEFMNFQPMHFDGILDEIVSYHIKMLAQAGLVEADDVSTMSGWDWRAKSLTYAGHEFLNAARDEGNWNEAKQTILQKSGALTFGILQSILLTIAERKLLGQ
ncbi:MAG: DUF2513 domain-containing protein [Thermoleophilia bacterium]